MIVLGFQNRDTTVLAYTFPMIGSIDQSITTVIYPTTSLSMTACVNMVSQFVLTIKTSIEPLIRA